VDRKGKSRQAVDGGTAVLYISTIPEIATFETPARRFFALSPSVRLAGADAPCRRTSPPSCALTRTKREKSGGSGWSPGIDTLSLSIAAGLAFKFL
jgi:hypothetical protein